MTDLRKAAEMALEALEDIFDLENKDVEAIQALRQALAEPANSTTSVVEPKASSQTEQEPECVAVIGNWGKVEWKEGVFPQLGGKLYTAPPKREWVGLTDEELEPMCDDWRIIFGPYVHDFTKAIEAKLKEKNT
jgi:hypothetical protein